jgi:EpsD family peptidyl-prolyl cis-trans isomerase
VLAVIILSACNPKPKTAGQVAAEVNGQEVTVHELNRRLVNVPIASPDLVPKLKREILDELIDRKLLVQRAVEVKLDRDPDIMRAVEQAREAVLAEALVEREMIGSRAEPSGEQIQVFLTAHPELFAKRRIYELVQFTVASGDLGGQVLSRLDDVRGARDVEEVLKGAKIAYQSETATRAAEQLPMELAAKLLPLTRGDVVTFTDGPQAYLVYVQDFQEGPVDDPQARLNIAEYLRNIKKKELVAAALKKLRAEADIKYFGEFESAAVGVSNAPGGSGSESRDAAEKTLPPHVERGLSGLGK